MSITNLPFEIFGLFVEFGENKIEKRKIYYFLVISIKEFGLKSLDKKISEKYYEKLSLKQFQFIKAIKSKINPYTKPIDIVSTFLNNMEGNNIEEKINFVINMYEYLTLTKDGLSLLNHVKFRDMAILKFIEDCSNSDIFFAKIFYPNFLIREEYSDVICRLLQIDDRLLYKIQKSKFDNEMESEDFEDLGISVPE
jgi:hypothetical protein